MSLCIGWRGYIYEVEAAGCQAAMRWLESDTSGETVTEPGLFTVLCPWLATKEGSRNEHGVYIRRNASLRLIGLSPIDVNGGPMFDALHELNHAFNLAAGLSVPQREELVSVFTRSEKLFCTARKTNGIIIKLLSGRFSKYFSRSDYVNTFRKLCIWEFLYFIFKFLEWLYYILYFFLNILRKIFENG